MGLHNKGENVSRRPTCHLCQGTRQGNSINARVVPNLIGNRVGAVCLPRFPDRRSGVPTNVGVRRLISTSLTTMFLCSLGEGVRRASEERHVTLFPISVGPPYTITNLHSILIQGPFRVHVHRSNGN